MGRRRNKIKTTAPPAEKTDGAVSHAAGWQNLLTNVGLMGADKRLTRQFNVDDLLRAQNQLEDFYAGDDMIARIVDLIPAEMTREWIEFKCDGDPELPKKVMAWLDDLQCQQRLNRALVYSRLYGGSAIILGADDGQPSNKPLREDALRGMYWLTALDRFSLRPDLPYADPFSVRYGQPEFYFMQSQLGTSQGEPTRLNDAIHESRILRFDGVLTTPRRQMQNLTWGESILVRVINTIGDFQNAWQSTSYLLQDFSQAVFTIKNLAKMIAANQSDAIRQRFQLIEMSRSVARAIVLDDGETFERKPTPLTQLPELLDRFASRLAAAVKIPVTLLMGESPAGLQATGSSDIRFFYDQIKAEQERVLRPAINRILSLALRAPNGPTGGQEPDNWSFEFKPLWQLDDLQESDRRLKIAQADALYFQSGVLTAEEIAVSRFGSDGYSVETNLDETTRAAFAGNVGAKPETKSAETGAGTDEPQRMSPQLSTDDSDERSRGSFIDTKKTGGSRGGLTGSGEEEPAPSDFSEEDEPVTGSHAGQDQPAEEMGEEDTPVTGKKETDK